MVDEVSIYTLLHPKTKEIRYVGVTKNTLRERLSQHWRERNSDKSHKNNWVKKLEREGLRPLIRLLEVVPYERWEEREKFWIERMKQNGIHLTNSTVGGDGIIGLPPEVQRLAGIKSGAARKGRPLSKERNRKAAESMRKRWQKPGEREKHSAILFKALANPESRKKMSDAAQRAAKNPETLRRKSESTKKAWADPEYRRKHLEGNKAARERLKQEQCKNSLSADTGVSDKGTLET